MRNEVSSVVGGLEIAHYRVRGAYVLVLRGAADIADDPELEDAFIHAMVSGLPLIVDLSELSFGDEELLGHLIHAQRATEFALVGPITPAFQRRLDTTGTTALFTIHPDLTTALGR
ncbi:STAS domain-containing protein [Streptomyces sp. NPDC094466]|uniref:STAS domain-containing protein n=1 Tax=Streptomyces sp. NPDC094466 TaxID=3366065 RepID=UPI0038092491